MKIFDSDNLEEQNIYIEDSTKYITAKQNFISNNNYPFSGKQERNLRIFSFNYQTNLFFI